MLTMVTEVFGVRGEFGDLIIQPKLMKVQFDENETASVKLNFANKEIEVVYVNPKRLDYGQYHITKAVCDGIIELKCIDNCGIMNKEQVAALDSTAHRIYVELS